MKKYTFKDFTTEVTNAKSEYQTKLTEYGWKYKTHEEQLGNIEYFMIASRVYATKIIFDHETNALVKQTYYKNDIETINKLQSQLETIA